ncbi:MAG: L-arabinose isomerase [Bacteroidetes bacterium]|jgi:L-arabinose isomerase|nr:L-arabinose isomerase [Bacteroidota bacterium]
MSNSIQEVWFVTGSQHLYGEETLKQVEAHSKEVAKGLADNIKSSVTIEFKSVLTTSDAINRLCIDANSDPNCIGLIAWMHTFSPAKMWIKGLNSLAKPYVHLHTQFNRDIPWKEIDMDFMNLNQSAHGGREFGYINARMGINRKVIVGHWKEQTIIEDLDVWISAAKGKNELSNLKLARFGDNMRNVAVTEGNKVSAEMEFGLDVKGFGVGDLVEYVNAATEGEISALMDEYKSLYTIPSKMKKDDHYWNSVKEAARIEIGLKKFLDDGGFKAFTTTFEDLHGLHQLPGLPVQRLMQKGYGFGAEGDWKTSALLRTMKVMSDGLKGGDSFMEDYTYNFDPKGNRVLGSHMLEICPSIADDKPSLEVHPLGIGGKNDPARLVFNAAPGNALNVSLMDMGNRYRLLVNKVQATDFPDLPKLPVARVLWDAKPNLKVAATSWILAGGAHHTVYTESLTTEHIIDFAEMFDIECLVIDEHTNISDFKKEIRHNEVYYHLNQGLR